MDPLLADSFKTCLAAFRVLEENATYLNLDPPSAHAAGRVSAGQRPLLATWPCTRWVELYPASDGTLTCGDPIAFTTLRWIQA
jgi:hypothetical protein